MQVAYPHFDISFGGIVFGLRSLAVQSVLFGLFRTFFIIGWKKDAVCLALMHVFGLPLTAKWYQFCPVQVHFTKLAGQNHIVKDDRAA